MWQCSLVIFYMNLNSVNMEHPLLIRSIIRSLFGIQLSHPFSCTEQSISSERYRISMPVGERLFDWIDRGSLVLALEWVGALRTALKNWYTHTGNYLCAATYRVSLWLDCAGPLLERPRWFDGCMFRQATKNRAVSINRSYSNENEQYYSVLFTIQDIFLFTES